MKNYFLFVAIMVILIIVIFSCRKSVDPEVNPNQMTNSSNETELKIQSFLDRMHNELKDETTYSIEDAIWYVEATLNYTYAIYDSSLVYISIDTSKFTVEIDSYNIVTGSDLVALYDDMVDSLDTYYDGLNVNIKRVFYCDVKVTEIAAGRLEMIMVAAIACGNSSYQWSYFDEDDYWYSILEWGKCNGYSGTGDAADRLQYAMMNQLTIGIPNVRIYWTDIVTPPRVYSSYYPYSPAPREYRGFYHYGTGTMIYPQCCSPDELEFYMTGNGIYYIIDDINPREGREFKSIIIEGQLSNGIGYWQEVHSYDITYGIKQETEIPATEL